MNKAELVEKVAHEVGLTKKDVTNIVDAVTSVLADYLAAGEKVTLVGFGTFQVRKRRTLRGINPMTGASITIAAKNVPKFQPGKTLRDSVK